MKKFILAGIVLLFSFSNTLWGQELVYLTNEQIHIVKRGVANSLKDPDSARFGDWMLAIEGTYKGTNVLFVCGLVNGRNSFGGYVGFHRFVGILFPYEFYTLRLRKDYTTETLCYLNLKRIRLLVLAGVEL